MDYKFYITERHDDYLMISHSQNGEDPQRMEIDEVNKNYEIKGDMIVTKKEMKRKMKKVSRLSFGSGCEDIHRNRTDSDTG